METNSSGETTKTVLETLLSLVSQPDGASIFTTVEDLTPLTEIAPSQPLVLDILLYAWLNSMAGAAEKPNLRPSIDKTVGNLVASFKGTDAVTLLAFLAKLLPKLELEVRPPLYTMRSGHMYIYLHNYRMRHVLTLV